MPRSTDKIIAVVASAAFVASLCPVSAAYAHENTELLGASSATHEEASSNVVLALDADTTTSNVLASNDVLGMYTQLEQAFPGINDAGVSLTLASESASEEEAASNSADETAWVALSETSSIETVKELIRALPDAPKITAAGAGVYDAQVEAAVAAYSALSKADQQTLDTESFSGQSYGRTLESAQWAVKAIHEVDNSTTLASGTYSETTVPALSSEYSKGKSTSPRQRPWSVKDVTVKDGKAYGTVTVESSSYTYLYMSGQKFENTAKTGNSTFENVPIDLNSTQYLTAYSTSMLTEIAFSLTTTIDETPSGDKTLTPEQVEKLIGALPSDPYAIDISYVVKVHDAQTAYDALTSEEKAQVNAVVLPSGVSCERALEVAQWAVNSLSIVDNSTTLVSGVYKLEQGVMKTDMGCSDSARNLTWSVVKIVVNNGKATATLKRSGGNTPIASAYFEGRVIPANEDGTFTIPIAFNTDLYFATMSSGATDSTVGVSYHLNTAFDVDNAKPDAVIDDNTNNNSDDDSNKKSDNEKADTQNNSTTPTASVNTTGNVSSAGSGNALGLTSGASAKTAETSTTSAQTNATGVAAGSDSAQGASSQAELSGANAQEGSASSGVSPWALGGGFAGVALAGGAGFSALFRKREQH